MSGLARPFLDLLTFIESGPVLCGIGFELDLTPPFFGPSVPLLFVPLTLFLRPAIARTAPHLVWPCRPNIVIYPVESVAILPSSQTIRSSGLVRPYLSIPLNERLPIFPSPSSTFAPPAPSSSSLSPLLHPNRESSRITCRTPVLQSP